nr:odorant-binding protein [Lasioderma serricorne]
MKAVCVFVVCFLAATVSAALDDATKQQIKEHLYSIGKECNKEIKADPEEIENMKNKEPPKTHEGKCLIFCVHKELKFQGEDGKVTKDAAIEKLQMLKDIDEGVFNQVKEAFEKCADEVKEDSDPCETAYQLMVCGKKLAKEMSLEGSLLP